MQRLGDYIDQIRGVSYKPADVRDENAGIAILRANNIQDKVDLSDLVYVDENKVSDVQFLKKGDVLICASSGSKNLVGKAVLIPNDMNASFGAFCKVVRIKQISQVNSDFIRMFFLSKNYRNAIAECSIGANINNIKSDHLNGLGINIPNYDIQCSAVDYLTKLKQAIDLKRKQLEDLDELVKSKFQEMFGNPVENDKRWEMRVWKELFDTILGKMLDVKKQNSDDEIRLYLGNKNVQWRSFDLNGLKTMTFSNKEIDKLSLKKGDILICEGGESGRCAVWEEENSNILFQKAIHRARIKDPNVIEPHFIPFLMEFLRENNGLKNYVTQATIEHLTGEKLNKLSIIVPPIEQQKVFAEFARKADAANAIIKQEISDLEEMMDSKMDEYFG